MAPKASRPITWAQAFRDVFLRLFSSQKYIPTLGAAIIFVALFRAKSDDIPKIIASLTDKSHFLGAIGWVIAVVVVIASIIVLRTQRKLYLGEIDRLTSHRNDLQEKLLERTVQHSTFQGSRE